MLTSGRLLGLWLPHKYHRALCLQAVALTCAYVIALRSVGVRAHVALGW